MKDSKCLILLALTVCLSLFGSNTFANPDANSESLVQFQKSNSPDDFFNQYFKSLNSTRPNFLQHEKLIQKFPECFDQFGDQLAQFSLTNAPEEQRKRAIRTFAGLDFDTANTTLAAHLQDQSTAIRITALNAIAERRFNSQSLYAAVLRLKPKSSKETIAQISVFKTRGPVSSKAREFVERHLSSDQPKVAAIALQVYCQWLNEFLWVSREKLKSALTLQLKKTFTTYSYAKPTNWAKATDSNWPHFARLAKGVIKQSPRDFTELRQIIKKQLSTGFSQFSADLLHAEFDPKFALSFATRFSTNFNRLSSMQKQRGLELFVAQPGAPASIQKLCESILKQSPDTPHFATACQILFTHVPAFRSRILAQHPRTSGDPKLKHTNSALLDLWVHKSFLSYNIRRIARLTLQHPVSKEKLRQGLDILVSQNIDDLETQLIQQLKTAPIQSQFILCQALIQRPVLKRSSHAFILSCLQANLGSNQPIQIAEVLQCIEQFAAKHGSVDALRPAIRKLLLSAHWLSKTLALRTAIRLSNLGAVIFEPDLKSLKPTKIANFWEFHRLEICAMSIRQKIDLARFSNIPELQVYTIAAQLNIANLDQSMRQKIENQLLLQLASQPVRACRAIELLNLSLKQLATILNLQLSEPDFSRRNACLTCVAVLLGNKQSMPDRLAGSILQASQRERCVANLLLLLRCFSLDFDPKVHKLCRESISRQLEYFSWLRDAQNAPKATARIIKIDAQNSNANLLNLAIQLKLQFGELKTKSVEALVQSSIESQNWRLLNLILKTANEPQFKAALRVVWDQKSNLDSPTLVKIAGAFAFVRRGRWLTREFDKARTDSVREFWQHAIEQRGLELLAPVLEFALQERQNKQQLAIKTLVNWQVDVERKLQDALADPITRRREGAIVAYGHLGRSQTALIPFLTASNSRLRAQSIPALARMIVRLSANKERLEQEFQKQLEAALLNSSDTIVLAALNACAIIKQKAGGLKPRIIPHLNHFRADIRVAAINALSHLTADSTEIVPKLVNALSDKSEQVIRAAALAIDNHATVDPKIEQLLEKQLETNKDSRTRVVLLKVIGSIKVRKRLKKQ